MKLVGFGLKSMSQVLGFGLNINYNREDGPIIIVSVVLCVSREFRFKVFCFFSPAHTCEM